MIKKVRKLSLFFVICYLLFVICFVSCDLFTGPKVDLFQEISNEVDWAKAEKLMVRIDYPSAWGRSNPPQGDITPTRDIRKGYEFGVEFTPDTVYTLKSWQVYLTSDLDKISGQPGQIGNWLEDTTLIATEGIESLGPDEVTLPVPDVQSGTFKFIINTTKPVTLVPWCETQPRITRTDPRNRPTGDPVSRANTIVIYFNGALNDKTVKFADIDPDTVKVAPADIEKTNGIWITAASLAGNPTVTTNKDNGWYNEPEFIDAGGFFMVTIRPKSTLPPGNSLMTVKVKGIQDMDGASMEGVYSFSWKTRESSNIRFNSWSAVYADSGSINVNYSQTGADKVGTYYRLNKGSNNNFDAITTTAGTGTATINNVPGPDVSGVREGRQINGIREYEIFIELYEGDVVIDFASFKIWNFPGMSVSKTSPAVEIKTMADLAAMKDGLGKQYVLANDITVSGAWTPVGASAVPFTGKFYGNGHKITFNSGGSIGGTANHRGLFGYVQNAVIRDFTFEYNVASAISISAGSTDSFIGGVAGYLKNTTVNNVITSGGTLGLNAAGTGLVCLGGIAGHIENGLIANCRAGLNVKLQSGGTGVSEIGAVAGFAQSGSGGTIPINIGYSYTSDAITIGPTVTLSGLAIDGVTITADVSGNTKGSALNIGGAVGGNSNNTMRDIIVSGGEVSFGRTAITEGTSVGGVIGFADNTNMEACSFAGDAIGKIDDLKNIYVRMGGLIGHYETNSGNVYINNCLVRGNIKIEEEIYTGMRFDGGVNIGGVLGVSMYKAGNVNITNSFFEEGDITAACSSGSLQAGGFCGSFFEEFEIEKGPTEGSHNLNNCGVKAGTVNINVRNYGRYIYAGGFISQIWLGGVTSNCFSRANVISRASGGSDEEGGDPYTYTHQAGGFTGALAQGATLKSCYATGNVRSVHNGKRDLIVGGLVGNSGGTMENCYALGDVLADNTYNSNAGGLVGNSWNGCIQYSFSAGQVIAQSAESNAYAGGIVGGGYNMISNTAALGGSVTASGPLFDIFYPEPGAPEDSNPVYIFGCQAGRIVGSGSDFSNNYAHYKMLVGTGEYQKRITGKEVDETDTGSDTIHGEDITVGSHTVSDTFWRTTLGLGSSTNNNGNMWDFSTVVGKGYPVLKGLAGQ